MKKLLVVMLVLLINGCGGGSGSSSTPKTYDRITDLENTTLDMTLNLINGKSVKDIAVFGTDYTDSGKTIIFAQTASDRAIGCQLFPDSMYNYLCAVKIIGSSLVTGYGININGSNISGKVAASLYADYSQVGKDLVNGNHIGYITGTASPDTRQGKRVYDVDNRVILKDEIMTYLNSIQY